MPWMMPAAIIGSSLLSGQSARSAASASADAQLRAAQIAADAARFRPVGVTTRFGTSQFQFSPEGYVSGAGYTVSPELQAYQNRLLNLAGTGLTEAELAQQRMMPLTTAATSLFNLGQQYLGRTPEQVAQDYMAKQQALLAPGREQQSAQLLNQLSNTGRTGLSIAQGGGLSAANPEFAALANARAMQDLQLAADAQRAGQQNVAFGAGLFGSGNTLLNNYYSGLSTATSPFQTNLGLTGTIEDLGRSALDIGSNLGGRTASAGANVGQSLLSGGILAARTGQEAGKYNPLASIVSGAATNPALANWMSNRGAGGGITSPDMGVWGYNDVYGGGQLPVGYANL